MSDASLGKSLYLTYKPTIVEWSHGKALERLVIPPGEITDYSSIPDKGLMGWVARRLGFNKSDPWFTRAGKIHDVLYFYIKINKGILPDGWFQFFNPLAQTWQPVIAYQWDRKKADAIWCRISIEDGCNPKVAHLGYWMLRRFGGIYMFFH